MTTKTLQNYNYRSPPQSTRPEDMARYTVGEFRSISRAFQSVVDHVTTQGATLSAGTLSATGVTAGAYSNPTVTVAQDGRITRIASGDSPFPKGGLSGQVLAADGNGGVTWRYAASSGGSGGGASTTIVQAAKAVDSADLAVSANATAFSLALKPTGVAAGTYENVRITVDVNGRVTAITSLLPIDPDVKYAPDGGRWRGSLSNSGVYSFTLVTAADALTAEDSFTMIATEDGADYIGI